MSDGPAEATPAGVPQGAKQAGEVRARWAWVEPVVWSERMLEALEEGVKGGKWFSLIDHQRWPNAYFAKLGLFSLAAAREMAVQSARR